MRRLLGLLLALVAPAQAAIVNDGFEARMPVSDWVAMAGAKDGSAYTTVSVDVVGDGALILSGGVFTAGTFPTTPTRIVGVEFRIAAKASHAGIVITGVEWNSQFIQDDPPFISLDVNAIHTSQSPAFDIGGLGDLAGATYFAVGGYAAMIDKENRVGLTSADVFLHNSSYWTDTSFAAPGYGGNPLILSYHNVIVRFASIDGYNATVYVDAVDVRLHYEDSSTAAMTGSGTMTATVQKMKQITAAVSGGGIVAASMNANRLISADMTGTGKIAPVLTRDAGGTIYRYLMPELSGNGTMAITPLIRRAPVPAAMSGSGTMAVTLQRGHGVTLNAPVTMVATGTLAQELVAERPIASAMTGSGTISATPVALRPIATAFSGSGIQTVAMIAQRVAHAAMNGVGTMAVTLQRVLGSTPVAAAMDGVGTMTADMIAQRPVAAAISGVGTVGVTGLTTNTRLPAPEGRTFIAPNDMAAFIIPNDFQSFEAQE